jgi:U3 small nucleolar RNA-associated protein 22
VSPTLRYTKVFIPQSAEEGNVPVSWVPFLDVIIQFESSGHWPDDLEAIRHTKTAFYLRMAEELQSQLSLDSTVTEDWLEVKSGGFMFRVVIYHERDLMHLQKTQDLRTTQQFERDFIHRPKLSSSIHTLATQNSSFSTTVRLAKRWVHSHLFSSMVSEEAIELLVAHVFLSPRPYDPPTSPFVGFLRFLDLLANFDWSGQPLIINLDRELTAQMQTEIVHHFNATLQQPSHPALYLATPFDPHSTHWTAEHPSHIALNRLIKFAQSMLRAALEGIETPDAFNFKVLSSFFLFFLFFSFFFFLVCFSFPSSSFVC